MQDIHIVIPFVYMLIMYSALCALIKSSLSQRFPTFLHLRTPCKPVFLNFTLHITKLFVISAVSINSNLYFDVCAFLRHSIFFRVHLNVLIRTPGCTRTPGWELMVQVVLTAYPTSDDHLPGDFASCCFIRC
jgi:hypothetical protein